MGPHDTTIKVISEGTTAQMCGHSKVAERWIKRYFVVVKKYRDSNGGIQKTIHAWWPEWRIQFHENGEFVKHIYREHNQVADRMANW